jgi:hypothetical protein
VFVEQLKRRRVFADKAEVPRAARPPKQDTTLVLGALISLALVAWAAGEFIRSF